ncbi:alanine racemase [Lipingzhangella sp. LS1_29]|uniref:Alanine racemase n=2 Tax=Lipingzhangella rawalii TaxID=2055835 RepID=A0ABU2H9K0_9ACTN|nr:alanine racemase [Lipingzhangella rawalii]MDS1271963.1 alanine racemase [Lipingzhangella rawalii]
MTRISQLHALNTATSHLTAPFATVDRTAFRANATALAEQASHVPIRVASKSVRCRELLRHVLAQPGFSGVLAFTLPEALWLASTDVSNDIVVAYPTTDTTAIERLANDPAIRNAVTLMVDDVRHLDLIAAAAPAPAEPIRVCIDIDASWQPLGPRLRLGAHRSPIRTPEHATALARDINRRPQVQLEGVMAYEAQIAGVGDAPAGRPLTGLLIRELQRRSRRELARRRAAIIAAIREVAPLRFVNGGGTGSVSTTSREPAITELAAGSGLYQPALFDHYRDTVCQAAAMFALPVTRRPAPGMVTLLGGGYPASGAPGRDRLPVPHMPDHLHYTAMEGAGEVQTPMWGTAASHLTIGDRVWLRHAKAGELCERFNELHLVDTAADGTRSVVDTVPTYRGEGHAFL